MEIIKCDIEKDILPFDNNSLSLIVCSEVFEHLYNNPIRALSELHRVMSSTGSLILATPNLYSLKNIFLFNTGNSINDPTNEFAKVEGLGHFGHIREYSVKEVAKFLDITGFKIIEVKYRRYNKSKRKVAWFLVDIIDSTVKYFRPDLVFVCRKK